MITRHHSLHAKLQTEHIIMDLALALCLLSPQPPAMSDQHVAFASALGVVPIPYEWIEPEQRAQWFIANEELTLTARVEAALDAGMPKLAWQLVGSLPGGPADDLLLAQSLRRWANDQRRALELRGGNNQVQMAHNTGAGKESLIVTECSDGLGDMQQLLSSLSQPRWVGPLLLVRSSEAWQQLDSEQNYLSRPALPILRLDPNMPTEALRSYTAQMSCQILLELSASDHAWPAWFASGLPAVAAAKARGEGPSPRGMQSIRKQAGTQRIRAVLLGHEQDPELAMAITALLTQKRRRRHLPALMELFYNGADSLSALEIAYRLDIATLATIR